MINLRCSFNTTVAARCVRLLLKPQAMADKVPVLQGQITIELGAPLPEATGDIQSSSPNTTNLFRSSSISISKVLFDNIRCITKFKIHFCCQNHFCSPGNKKQRLAFPRQSGTQAVAAPYWAPEAPVMANVTLSGFDELITLLPTLFCCKPELSSLGFYPELFFQPTGYTAVNTLKPRHYSSPANGHQPKRYQPDSEQWLPSSP